MTTELSEATLKTQVEDLRQSIQVLGIPEHNLIGRMLKESLKTCDRALSRKDFQTVGGCLANTRSLLEQWSLSL